MAGSSPPSNRGTTDELPAAPVPTSARKRIGRPPRIDRETIARAVVEIGFDEVTMKRAADHIGVSVPGLYHYVKGRDDLIRLAADYAVSAVDLPVYSGQTWQEWLREWGRYVDRSMSDRPEVFQHFLTAGLDDGRVLEVMGTAIERLVEAGLTPGQAIEAWQAVASVALGAAANRIRERAATEQGHPWPSRVHAVLARLDPDQFPAMHEIAAAHLPRSGDALERQLDIVILGIEARLASAKD